MLKSPNNVQIEANQGRGEIIVRGYMKAERARVENLSAPVLESMQRQLEELRLQITAGSISTASSSSAPLPVPAAAPTAPAAPVVQVAAAPASPPVVTSSQLFKLQEQIATLNARLNTLQDRVQAMESRMASSSSAGAGGAGRIVSDVANAVAAGVVAEVSSVATEQIHKAAMKLEDMVSPGALYNLRKVSRENVKFAW